MKIGGKRGIQNAKGYCLKDPNKSGKIYIYIWDKNTYDSKEVSEKRKENKNYSKVGGWECLGRFDNPETWKLLKAHLTYQYGTMDEIETMNRIKEEVELMEKKRIIKEKEEYRKLMDEIIELLDIKNQRLDEIPANLKEAKKLYKRLTK